MPLWWVKKNHRLHSKTMAKIHTPSNSSNSSREIRVEKVTLNVGVGKNEEAMKKALILLQKITGQTPVKTTTKKRIPGWGLRPGLTIGCKVTIRNKAQDLLKRLLVAKGNTLSMRNFDALGNFSFGIHEYIDIPGMEYDPDLKIIGLEVAVTLERPGFRIKRRKIKTNGIGKNHMITEQDAMSFARGLGVEVVNENELQ